MSRHPLSLCFVIFSVFCFLKPCDLASVTIRHACTGDNLGTVRGNMMTSRLGRDFYSFRRIPYAKPPIGPLRFRDPIPMEPWSGTIDATKDAPLCPQSTPNASYPMSEDCLYMNVYTHRLPQEYDGPKKLLPVMVYVHPGSFTQGSGTSTFHAGPEYLMDRDIVFVTFNYRLGALGFMSTGTKECNGNFGLKDQIVVLEWVRDYIKNFGGDPNSVTVFGCSVGGVSGDLFLVSPMAQGLFHRVIAMSSTLTSVQTVPCNQLETAREQARIFNCKTDDITEMMDCLRGVDAMELAFSIVQLYVIPLCCPNHPFSPVIESDFGQRRFLVEDPTVSFQTGRFARVPLVTGITKNELLFLVNPIIMEQEYLDKLSHNFNELAPICFGYDSGTEQSRIATETFRRRFLPGPIQNDSATADGLDALFSDGQVGFPMYRLIQLISGAIPIHYYEYVFAGRYTYVPYDDGRLKPVHYDDLMHIVALKFIAPPFTRNDPESIIIERLTRFWTQFAATGNPNSFDDPYLNITNWTQTSSEEYEYLEIGHELTMKSHLNRGRYALWDELFPLDPVSDNCRVNQSPSCADQC